MAIEFPVAFLQTCYTYILAFEHEDSHLIDVLYEYRSTRD